MVTGKSTKETVKTIAQGMPVDPAPPVVTAACFFVAGGPWVRPSPGIPCALFSSARAKLPANLGRLARRETLSAAAMLFVIRIRASSTGRRVADLAGDDVAEQFPRLAVE